MGKKLAIQGHSTRGKEVIKLLEMMGGKHSDISGSIDNKIYYIDDNRFLSWDFIGDEEINEYEIFTLEDFLEKFPYKVGDKVLIPEYESDVRICEMKWDEDVSDMKYCVAFGNGVDFGWFANNSINFFKIKKNENLEENKFPPFEPMFKVNDELEYKIPDGYEITEVSKNTVFIKPIKPKYPTTYEDCCKVLGISYRAQLSYTNPDVERGNIYLTKEKHLLDAFMKLRICRNAYWKIAGEQMGLDKPWEPDWSTENDSKYVIEVYRNNVRKNFQGYSNTLLAFPTIEMRDAFYENFKDLIEQCKELL